MSEISNADHEELREFLKKTFALSQDLAEKYARIAILLSDDDRMIQCLGRVSDAVQIIHGQLEQRLDDAARQGLRGRQNLLGKSILLLVKALGWDITKNYQLQGNVNPDAFNALVQGGSMWRDHISTSHGDYSHCLQWLAIYCELGEETLDLYKQSVNYTARNGYKFKRRFRGVQALSDVSLWVFLVDCFPGGEDCPDWKEWISTRTCRSPTKINQLVQYSRFADRTLWLSQAVVSHYEGLEWLTRRRRIRRIRVDPVSLPDAASRGFSNVRRLGSNIDVEQGAILEKVDPSLKYRLEWFNLMPE